MSQSDKNWKNKATVMDSDEVMDTSSWGTPLQNILQIGTIFTHKAKSYQINSLKECELLWRTHVHINGSHCFDTRTLVKHKN